MQQERPQQLFLAQAQDQDGAPGRPFCMFLSTGFLRAHERAMGAMPADCSFDLDALCPMTPAQAWNWRRWSAAGAQRWEA